MNFRGGSGNGPRRPRSPAQSPFPADDDITPVPHDVHDVSKAWEHATRVGTRNADKISAVNQLLIAHAADSKATDNELRRRMADVELVISETVKEIARIDKQLALALSQIDRLVVELANMRDRSSKLVEDLETRRRAASVEGSNWRRLLVQIVPTTIAAAIAVVAFSTRNC